MKNRLAFAPAHASFLLRGHSLMVKFQPSKLAMRVRFPLPALFPLAEPLIRTAGHNSDAVESQRVPWAFSDSAPNTQA
jgi:hypothetical protein